MSSELVVSSEFKPACSCNSCAQEMALSPEAKLGLVASEFCMRVEVVGAYSPVSRREASVRGVLECALSSKLRVSRSGAVPASPTSVRSVELRSSGVASPKLVVSPAIHSVREAARARKVARLARRLRRLAEDHIRQQM